MAWQDCCLLQIWPQPTRGTDRTGRSLLNRALQHGPRVPLPQGDGTRGREIAGAWARGTEEREQQRQMTIINRYSYRTVQPILQSFLSQSITQFPLIHRSLPWTALGVGWNVGTKVEEWAATEPFRIPLQGVTKGVPHLPCSTYL